MQNPSHPSLHARNRSGFRRAFTLLLLAFGLAATPGHAGGGVNEPPIQTVNFQSAGTVVHQFSPLFIDEDDEVFPGFVQDTFNLSSAPTLTANFAGNKVLVFTFTAPPGKQIRVTPAGNSGSLSFSFRPQPNFATPFFYGTLAPPVWENGQGALPAGLSSPQLLYSTTSSNFVPSMVLPVTGSFAFTKLTVTTTLPPEAVASFANHPLVEVNAFIDAEGLNTDPGPAVAFETIAAPTVTSPTSASLTANSATLGGTVTASVSSPIAQRGIVISPTAVNADPTSLGAGMGTLPEGGTTTGVFTRPVGGLTPGTSYSYAAYAINSAGPGYSAVATFTTPAVSLSTIVTNTNNSGVGSLRQAVLNANANAGPDTITFDPTVFATAQTIVLATSNLAAFTGDTTVTGPAAGVTVQGVSGSVFTVGAGTTASFSKLTVSGGSEGIRNLGTLTASNCVFSANSTGINNVNSATVTGCSFAEGDYSLSNGVVPVNAAATLTVSDCSFTDFTLSFIDNNGTATLSGCTADTTGSFNADYFLIWNHAGATLTLTNCSLLQASVSAYGMLNNNGTLAFQNCTLAETAESYNSEMLTLKNTIYRKHSASGTISNGTFTNGGGNLLLNSTGNLPAHLAADLTALGLDPTGLQNNGGPTKTFKLLGGPAINGGVNANVPVGLTTDQRGTGFPRSVGNVDIGAYEALYVDLVATTASAAEGSGAGTTAFTFTVSRPGATTSAVTLDYTVTGTGTNPADAADFGGTLPSGSVTLGVGVASNTITIAVSKDALVETDETFKLTLSNHAIAGTGAVATILNDDVTPTNSAPTDITLSNATIAENNAPGATIGTLTAVDPDAGQTHTFTFADDASIANSGPGGVSAFRQVVLNDNAAFTITGNVLSINGSADFETKSSYLVRIKATDNGSPAASFEKEFMITITDVLEVTGLTAVNDAVTTTTGRTTLYPLANDQNPAATLTAVSDPLITIDGRKLIVPEGYAGTFTYTTSDGRTASVTVIPGSPVGTATKWYGLLYDQDGAIAGDVSGAKTRTRVYATVKLGTRTVRAGFAAQGAPGVPTALGILTGSVNANGRLVISLVSAGETFTASARPAAQGAPRFRYNIALAGTDTRLVPGGGYMRTATYTSGRIAISCRLPDDRTVFGSSKLLDNGSFVFFKAIGHTSPKAFVGGEFVRANLDASDVTGELEWSLPPQSGGLHAAGLNATLTANGSIYTPSSLLPSGPVTIDVAGGDLAAPISIQTNASNGNPANTTVVSSWTVNRSSGAFAAHVNDPAQAGFLRAAGVYLPKSNRAWGFFPGSTVGGSIGLSVRGR